MSRMSNLRWNLKPSRVELGGKLIDRSVAGGKTLVQCEMIDCKHNSFTVNARPYCRLRKIRLGHGGECKEISIWGR